MEELFTKEVHTLSKTGQQIAAPVVEVKNVVSFLPSDEFSSSDTQKGDHVTALPYHSLSGHRNVSDVPFSMESYTGVFYYAGTNTQYAPNIHNWPWPTDVHKRFGQQISKGTWLVNLTRFAPPMSTKLPVVSEAEYATLCRLADTKALGNVRKALANLPMIIAERRETLQMIGGKVAQMAKGAHALQTKSVAEYRKAQRKLSKTGKAKLARRISNEHLEFVFGWLPAISEVEGLCEFIAKDNLDFIRSRGVQGFHDISPFSDYSSHKPPSTVATGPFAYRDWFSVTSNGVVRSSKSVRTALRYKLSSTLVGDAYALGFEPIGTAFDMVPLSFMSGWISNFDYWVRTLSPEFGLEFQTGSRNLRLHSSYELNMKGRVISDSGPMFVYGKTVDAKQDGYQRSDTRKVLTGPPEASLEWDVEVGLFEVTAGISLSIQRYLKPLRRSFDVKQFRYRGPRPKWLPKIRYTGRR